MLAATAWLSMGPSCGDTGGPVSSASHNQDAVLSRYHRTAENVVSNAQQMAIEGRYTFRFETFGDEAFWGDTLQLHRAISGRSNGGVGPGVSPQDAFALGLKVDAEALPKWLEMKFKSNQIDLADPKTTLVLLQLNAVVGLTGFFNPDKTLKSVGAQCSLCHSTVDDSLAPGIGNRLDGWANRDLKVGALLALAPETSALARLVQVEESKVRDVLTSWGPGMFDVELALNRSNTKRRGGATVKLIPPAYGLAGANLSTWAASGSLAHWNAFVSNVKGHTDLITSKLPALYVYQLLLRAPTPPPESFDEAEARRGRALFTGKAKCANCHAPPLFAEAGWKMREAAEVGIDDAHAKRLADERQRAAPLAGLFANQKRGFYRDGRRATLIDVVNHYNSTQSLNLEDSEKIELVEFLKSL